MTLELTPWFHDVIGHLLQPVLWLLGAACLYAVWEVGLACGERWWGLGSLKRGADVRRIECVARRRIERSDLLARVSPMLGLMGTIIPLGPGLAALGRGDPQLLADAVIVAFDATALGLAAGIIGLVLARLRRRWYEELLTELESAQ